MGQFSDQVCNSCGCAFPKSDAVMSRAANLVILDLREKRLNLRQERIRKKRRLSGSEASFRPYQQGRHADGFQPLDNRVALKGFRKIGPHCRLRSFRLYRRIAGDFIVQKSFHPAIPFFRGKMWLSSPEFPIGFARRISLTKLRDALGKRGVQSQFGGNALGRIRHISTVDQNQSGDKAGSCAARAVATKAPIECPTMMLAPSPIERIAAATSRACWAIPYGAAGLSESPRPLRSSANSAHLPASRSAMPIKFTWDAVNPWRATTGAPRPGQ